MHQANSRWSNRGLVALGADCQTLTTSEGSKDMSGKEYKRIHSSILGREVYIVSDIDVVVPDMTLLRFDYDEVTYLKKLKKNNQLDDEQLRVITMAKEEFGGSVIDTTIRRKKKRGNAQRKRAETRQVPRQNEVYEKPTVWKLKSKGRATV